MINRILLYLCLNLIVSSYCPAQNVYKHLFHTGAQGKLIELSNSNILYCFGGGFARIDLGGNIYYEKSFNVPSFIVTDMLRINDDELLICGAELDTCTAAGMFNFFQPGVFKCDSIGNIFWGKYYKLNGACGAEVFSSTLCSNNGILLLGGNAGSPQYPWSSGFVVKTDSTGDLVWSKYFNQNPGGVQFGIELTDKSVIIGLNLEGSGAVLARLDSSGNLLWSKSYIRPRGYVHSVLYEQDGTILVTGTTDSLKVSGGAQYPPWFHPNLFLMKIDTSGQIIWAKEYVDNSGPSNYFALDKSSIIKLFDGSYMIYSGKYTDSLFHRVLMMHSDMNGNILWNRSHGPSHFSNMCQYIIQTSDSDFLMSERIIGNYPNGWTGAFEIIKTDSLGHSIGCFEDTENINVYPYFPVDSNIVLPSIDGGYELTASIRDTTYGPVSTYDECTLVGDGIPNIIEKKKFTTVFPNPASDVLHISISISDNVSSRLEIFDAYGKKVFEKEMPAGTEMIDLNISDLTEGIYQLRIMNERNYSVSQFFKH